jgi:uncharacterized protein HemY
MFFFSNFLLSELDWEFLRIVLFKTKLNNVLISFSFQNSVCIQYNSRISSTTTTTTTNLVVVLIVVVGHAVAQLVEALRYKPKVREFDSRWCQ